MSDKNLYELEGVSRAVQSGRVILDIPHLAILQGRVTAVVGPNGAGKSTLMNTLAFLEPYDQGEIFFKGKRISGEDVFSSLPSFSTGPFSRTLPLV